MEYMPYVIHAVHVYTFRIHCFRNNVFKTRVKNNLWNIFDHRWYCLRFQGIFTRWQCHKGKFAYFFISRFRTQCLNTSLVVHIVDLLCHVYLLVTFSLLLVTFDWATRESHSKNIFILRSSTEILNFILKSYYRHLFNAIHCCYYQLTLE